MKTAMDLRVSGRGRIARYCAGLESPWDLSLASSNLALGANKLGHSGVISVTS